MLSIRREQITSMRAVRRREFEADLAQHLHTFFPAACEAIGQEALSAMIGLGVARAATYGILGRCDLFLYLDLMVVLGPRFDEELPWAKEALTDPSLPDPSARIAALVDMVIDLAREEEDEDEDEEALP